MSLTIKGIIGLVLTQLLGDVVSEEQIANFVEVGGLLIFGIMAWYGRYRQGDISILGKKQ